MKKTLILLGSLIVLVLFLALYWQSQSGQPVNEQDIITELRQQQAKLDKQIQAIKLQHTEVMNETKAFVDHANNKLARYQKSGEQLMQNYKETKQMMNTLQQKLLSQVNSGTTSYTLDSQQDKLMGLSIGLEKTQTTPIKVLKSTGDSKE